MPTALPDTPPAPAGNPKREDPGEPTPIGEPGQPAPEPEPEPEAEPRRDAVG